MNHENGTLRRPRPGGRSARVIQDVLTATLDELSAVGFNALSMESVAQRAGVNKTTVYRRWPSKLELVRAALLSTAEATQPAPTTGSLRADLTLILRALCAKLVSPQGQAIMRMLLTEGIDDPEVAAVMRSVRMVRRSNHVALIETAIARGELPADTDSTRLIESLSAAVIHRLYIVREPVEDADLEAMIDLVLDGARHGGAVRREHANAEERRASG